MKQITYIVFALACGCGQSVTSVQPTIDEATGLALAFQLSFVVENALSRPLGCATLLAVDDDSFFVAAPVQLVSEKGCQLVEWQGEYRGQKFERTVFGEFEVLSSDPRVKLAILKVSGRTSKHVLEFAETDSRHFQANFLAFSSRASQPRPLNAMAVKVSELKSARSAPDLPAADFFLVESGLDLKSLGSPLVTQQGQLAGVAVGNFWNSTLYCPATRIKTLLANDRDVAAKTANAP